MIREQVQERADYLFEMSQDAYLLGLNQQLVSVDLPHVSSITDPAVLDDLRHSALIDAGQMADTYNSALANQVYGQFIAMRSDLGTESSTFNLDQAVGQWAEKRAEWKAEQVAITTSNGSFNQAVQDFVRNNPGSGLTAHVTPDDCVCAGCQSLVDAGDMPIEEAMALDLPLHPGCVHEIQVNYDQTWDTSGDVWAGQSGGFDTDPDTAQAAG